MFVLVFIFFYLQVNCFRKNYAYDVHENEEGNMIINSYKHCRTRHRGGSKINSRLWKKNRFLASGSLKGKMYCLRSRHLVLWSVGTLTGQQKFYGLGLVT